MDKYWHKLLTYFYNKNYFSNGLTMPFIIGSRTIIEPSEPILSIQELLTDIKNANVYLSVLKCEYIGELVFSISNKSDFDIYGGFENIVDIDGFMDFNNLKDFSIYLNDIYMDNISKNQFSKNNQGSWEYFTETTDLPRLNELK